MFKRGLGLLLVLGLSGCGVFNAGTHNQSKGTCQAIAACQNGQCQSRDRMIQTHCEMLDGTFVPNQHQPKRWLFF